MKRLLLIVGTLLTVNLTYAQVGSYDTGVFPSSLPHDQTVEKATGAQAVSPGPKNSFYYWLGFTTLKGLGYNLESKKAGFWPADQNNYWGMKISFSDSVWDSPKSYQLNHDPDGWGAYLQMQNFNLEFWPDSTNQGKAGAMVKTPDLYAGIRGYGWTFGMFSVFTRAQALYGPEMIGGTQALPLQYDSYDGTGVNLTASTDGSKDPYKMYYLGYTPVGGMSAAYEVPDRLFAEVKVGSEGTSASSADGWTVGYDFRLTPLDPEVIDWKIQGDGIWAQGFAKLNTFGQTLARAGTETNPSALGLSTSVRWPLAESLWLKTGVGADLYAVASNPALTEDGVSGPLKDRKGGSSQSRYAAQLALQFSDETVMPDFWKQTGLPQSPNRAKKATAVNLEASFSEVTDLDVAVVFEEPEGTFGLDSAWGSYAALQVNNLLQREASQPQEWKLVTHQSYLLAENTLMPYTNLSVSSWGVTQVRSGLQFLAIPNLTVDIHYISANLNPSAQTSSGTAVAKDAGTLNLLFFFHTDANDQGDVLPKFFLK